MESGINHTPDLFSLSSIARYDRWGFIQKLEGDADEEAFLSMANKLERRSDELKVSGEAPNTDGTNFYF